MASPPSGQADGKSGRALRMAGGEISNLITVRQRSIELVIPPVEVGQDYSYGAPPVK